MARFNNAIASRIVEQVVPAILKHYKVPMDDCKFLRKSEDEGEESSLEDMPWIKSEKEDSGVCCLAVEFSSPKHPTMTCRIHFWATDDGWVSVEGWLSPSARSKVTTQLLHMSIPFHPCCERCAERWWKNFYSTSRFEEAVIAFLEQYYKMGDIICFKNYDVNKH